MKHLLTSLVVTVLFLLPRQTVSAHSFGNLYNLPVPFWMYLYGATAAIIFSFLVIGLFLTKEKVIIRESRPISQLFVIRFLSNPWVITTFQLGSVLLFAGVVIAGFVGVDDSAKNSNMTLFWIIFVLGLTYLTAITGDIYHFLNPLSVLTKWFEKIGGNTAVGILPYSKSVAYYPALIFYYLFIWIELMGNITPLSLSVVILEYSFLTVLGVIVFGKHVWFSFFDLFGVFFGLIGKMAPIEYKKKRVWLQMPFSGLVKEKASHLSILFFILFMLSSTAFDGFRSTRVFYDTYTLYSEPLLHPLLGDSSYSFYQTISLLLSLVFFFILYLLFIALAKRIANSSVSLHQLLLQFAFSLIPIAFVYNVAHYFTLVITEGSNMLRLISDPLGKGWNLFGTNAFPTIKVVDTSIVWHTQVIIILLGHIVGVYIAHLIALQTFPHQKKAVISQIPMLILMVLYTMMGLWILSQPLSPFVK